MDVTTARRKKVNKFPVGSKWVNQLVSHVRLSLFTNHSKLLCLNFLHFSLFIFVCIFLCREDYILTWIFNIFAPTMYHDSTKVVRNFNSYLHRNVEWIYSAHKGNGEKRFKLNLCRMLKHMLKWRQTKDANKSTKNFISRLTDINGELIFRLAIFKNETKIFWTHSNGDLWKVHGKLNIILKLLNDTVAPDPKRIVLAFIFTFSSCSVHVVIAKGGKFYVTFQALHCMQTETIKIRTTDVVSQTMNNADLMTPSSFALLCGWDLDLFHLVCAIFFCLHKM